jgi:putative mRNA 3-end processing factor
MIKRIPNAATAICSGWMQIRGKRRWQSVDAGFPVSDHADWDGLLTAVKATEAEKVYVTHGSQATFSKYLNDIGIPSEEVLTEYGSNEDESSKDTTEDSKTVQAS